MRTIAIASQKGGVGKTSLAQNLGYELALLGKRVLLVDFDPQSNLTMGWGLPPTEETLSVHHCLYDHKVIKQAIQEVRPRLFLLPASLDLAADEMRFLGGVDSFYKLSEVLDKAGKYDYILIDVPPSLGWFTINALVAAKEIIIPLQTHIFAWKALDQLMTIVETVRQKINKELSVLGIVLTTYDKRNKLSLQVATLAKRKYRRLVFETVIPINVKIAEAPLDGMPVAEHDPACQGAAAYKALATELLGLDTP